MKKILIFLVVIVAIFAIAFYFYTSRADSPTELTLPESQTETGEDSSFRPNPSNATFIFNDGALTLLSGKNERQLTPGSAFTEETILLDKFAYSDLNGDGKTDTILLLARYGAGSGTFIYIAGYISGPVTYRGTRALFVGDRISPQSLTIGAGGVINFEYLDRSPDEPLAAEPTVRVSKQFVFSSGELRER